MHSTPSFLLNWYWNWKQTPPSNGKCLTIGSVVRYVVCLWGTACRKVYKVIHINITMPQAILQKNILHYPQLDTILMVEEFIRDNPGEYKKKSLWQHLPRKMLYQTYCVIFDYLLESGKIAVDREGHICWIWNPELVRKYLSKPHLSWRKWNQK